MSQGANEVLAIRSKLQAAKSDNAALMERMKYLKGFGTGAFMDVKAQPVGVHLLSVPHVPTFVSYFGQYCRWQVELPNAATRLIVKPS